VADNEDAEIKSADTSARYAAERKRVGNRNLVKTNASAVLSSGTLAVTGVAAEPSEKPVTAAVQSVEQVKSTDVLAPPASGTAPVEDQNMGTAAEVAAADSQITAAVKSEIAVDSLTKDANIGVTTAHGVVALTGSLASQDAIDRARNLAAQVRDVKSVDTSALIIAKAPDAS
jgi:hyperosmotically inducible protein